MMNIVYKRVDEIIPYEKNPRINDAAVDAVAQSIKEFGFRVPIVLDKNNVIITGHTRLRSAKSIGLTEVPCIIADNLTPEQVQAYRIADNKTGEIAEWNYDLLPIELRDLQEKDFDLSLLSRSGTTTFCRSNCAICRKGILISRSSASTQTSLTGC